MTEPRIDEAFPARLRVGSLFYKGHVTIRELKDERFTWHFLDTNKEWIKTIEVHGKDFPTAQKAYDDFFGLHRADKL